jgi:anhydro-N-acetylmuramic acid kinase
MTGITVVGDFRRRDVAAGGQGAPLLPVFHDHVFRSDDEDRVIVNVGGIANVTILSRDSTVTGFDTGPGNRLLDAWIAQHQGFEYDENGRWAGTGTCDTTLLQQLLDEPYLNLRPPKSTGRELFNLPWLRTKLGLFAAARKTFRRRCSSSRRSPLPRLFGNTLPVRLSMCAEEARTINACSMPSPA